MTELRSSLDVIEDFLAQKRIAIVGISRDPKDFSSALFREMHRRGYEVLPVNPKATELMGRHCYARVQDIEPPVDVALLMTTPEAAEAVVRDCAQAGIHRVWMYRAGGRGAVSPEAVKFCVEHGIAVVPGECPFMFWKDSGFHRLHGFVRKMMGRYPRHED